MRLTQISCPLLAVLLAAPAHAAIDGKVAGLNETTFAALAAVKQRNPGSLTERDAKELATAIMADEVVDELERDLLEEMTQSQFRNITVTPAGDTSRSVMTFPTVGNAKRVLLGALNPQLDLDVAWTQDAGGWRDMIIEFKKSPEQETRVVAFVQGKLAGQWEASNVGNGFKPLRDLIARLYGYSNSAGADTNTGRTILYRAMEQLDHSISDGVPDFLYNWTRPS
ncbi:MAG: hypothetical protein R3C46_06355 [Hyphomonadaceae bacterium]